ncbi:DUF2237 domain-containing protein [Pelagibacteraceae bacterium]|jgi:uncharacterized protein|nr:DUF2237 domain-containing protein [Pelagibacteraceae bacterium]
MNKILQKNVLGEKLESCSNDPLTGWFRDGCCNTDNTDHGIHTVCAKVTNKFLEWSKIAGNDLITPHPEFNFPGLKDGDCWCICAATYAQSIEAGTACKIFLKKTNYKTLEVVSLEKLKQYAIDLS